MFDLKAAVNQCRPASLVAGSAATAAVTMKILMKQHEVLPMGSSR